VQARRDLVKALPSGIIGHPSFSTVGGLICQGSRRAGLGSFANLRVDLEVLRTKELGRLARGRKQNARQDAGGTSRNIIQKLLYARGKNEGHN
jgi:hypothetical protein